MNQGAVYLLGRVEASNATPIINLKKEPNLATKMVTHQERQPISSPLQHYIRDVHFYSPIVMSCPGRFSGALRLPRLFICSASLVLNEAGHTCDHQCSYLGIGFSSVSSISLTPNRSVSRTLREAGAGAFSIDRGATEPPLRSAHQACDLWTPKGLCVDGYIL